ncbi:MAG TPA: SBBP repeat-containing protein [Bryobacteraceae bacterium]|nr:SBBP repeat-containing protein [Bryobacteraceae bacterium]
MRITVIAFLLVLVNQLNGAVRPQRYFEPNRGQSVLEVLYSSLGEGLHVSLNRQGASVSMGRDLGEEVGWVLVGSEPSAASRPQSPTMGISNYLFGSDPDSWITEVPHFQKVQFDSVYPGIDAVYYFSESNELEYDFLVAPGADPARIRIRLRGMQSLRIAENGDLIVRTAEGDWRKRKPLAYQSQGDSTKNIAAAYVLHGRDEVTFRIGAYDPSKPLVIDPVVNFASYIGGSDADSVHAMAVDSVGNMYLTGRTDSGNFPGTTASNYRGGGDAFVVKLDPTGSRVIYSTYVGGSGDDGANGIAVDSSGAAYITGFTRSGNFPVSSNAGQRSYAGGVSDVFVAKLSASGSQLSYATYLGGFYSDFANAIAIDNSGNAYVTGGTESFNFPTTSNAFQPVRTGLDLDVFVSKLNSTGSDLIYSTFIIGELDDEAFGIAVDASGAAYVTGVTPGFFFPTTTGALKTRCNFDAFVTKLQPSGSNLAYSTCLGGSDDEWAAAIALTQDGGAIITGATESSDFPRTSSQALQGCGRAQDAFVSRLNNNGTSLVFSGCLSGSRNENGTAVVVDGTGSILVGGVTDSDNFPVTADAARGRRSGGEDGFLSRMDAGATALLYGTYLGGSSDDSATTVASDSSGRAFVGGATESGEFPVSANPFQRTRAGSSDGFFIRIEFDTQPPVINPNGIVGGASFRREPVAPGSIVALFGSSLASAVTNSAEVPLPTTLGGVQVKVNDRAVPLLYVAPTQINFLLPYVTRVGQAQVVVTSGAQTSSPHTFDVVAANPGVFFQSAGNQASVTNEDGSVNAADKPAKAGSTVTIWLTGIGQTDVAVLTGDRPPAGTLPRPVAQSVSVTIGDQPATIAYLGLAPSLVGGAQANVVVPNLPAGAHRVVVTIDGRVSNAPLVSVVP